MIFGLGTDLVDISRIANAEQNFKGRFSRRILGCDEYQIYEQYKKQSHFSGYAYLAKRFAAKEAFSKAIGTGIQSPMNWSDIQVLSDDKGKPIFFFSHNLEKWVRRKQLAFFVSLSDTKNMVIAVVIASNSA